MVARSLWLERRFDVYLPEDVYPLVCERLRGTPARLEDKVRGLSQAISTRRIGESWSIQEHVGHLLDLEPLWYRRIEDFLSGKAKLRQADITNRRTNEANHNATSIDSLLHEFRIARKHLIERLDGLEKEQIMLVALHPRLNQPMSVTGSVFFAAEHDDHHLTRMNDLITLLGQHNLPYSRDWHLIISILNVNLMETIDTQIGEIYI